MLFVDCHADFDKSARNDGIISPSLAEGVRGRVSYHCERCRATRGNL
ncbi:hypothetical protein [Helicobacter sp. T3_23-1059]